MTVQKKSPREFSFAELDRELVARGAGGADYEKIRFNNSANTPEQKTIIEKVKTIYNPSSAPQLNEALSHLSLEDITKALLIKIMEMQEKAIRNGIDTRKDAFEITEPRILKNSSAVASIWMKSDLTTKKNGTIKLNLVGYKKTFSLCKSEPFSSQLIAAGLFCTGFLVNEDVIATAAHFVNEENVNDLRFVFGYQMKDSISQVKQVAANEVYRGTKIIGRAYDPNGSGADWALVKTDRNVGGREPVRLSPKDISKGEQVYVLGHPCGLPLKHVPGAPVRQTEPAFFSADLTVYGGNSGSPVFSGKSHEVVGLVVRGDVQDFRWNGKGWMSLSYPNPEIKSPAPQCTNVSRFRKYCR